MKQVDLQQDGLLWLINRCVFHPRGYALAYESDTGNFYLLGDGKEPWVFSTDGSDETPQLEAVKRILL